MPRIISAVEPRGPAPVIDLQRPREVRPVPVGVADLGRSISNAGNMVLQHLVEQERQAVDTRLKARAVQLWGELENEIDAAGTVSEARALHEQRAPKIVTELQREAREAGLPEAIPDLDLIGNRSTISTRSALAKRAAQEGLDAIALFADNQAQLMVGARSEPDYIAHRAALHREVTRVAMTNPLLTPAQGEQLYRKTVEGAARDRALAQLNGVADDPGGLAAMRDALQDPARFPDLRLDDRGELVRQTIELSDAIENREWRRLQRQEVLLNRQREHLHLSTLQQHAGVLSQGGTVSDSLLLADVAAGRISNAYVTFLQGQRDGMIAETVDLDAYRGLRSAAEVGLADTADIEAALADGAFGSGTSAVGIARDLIDLSESAERQGGIFRRRDFIEAEDLASLALRGVTRDAPITLLEDPGDERANEFVMVASAVRRNVLTLLEQGTPADQINPFALYGTALRTVGATRPRPTPAEVAGPLANLAGRLSEARSVAEVEVIMEALRARIAERDTQDARDQLAEARRFMGALQRWQTAQQAAEALINAIPPEERR